MSAAATIIAEVARKLLGGIDADKVIADVKQEFAHELADLEARIEAKMRERFEAVGILLALDAADRGAAGVVGALEPKGTLPNFLDGADVQQMPADWHPEEPSPLESDAEPTKP